MIKILYNNCYGGFNFSDEFATEYKRRKGETISARGRLYRIGENSIRCDPVAVAIFEEFGSERSSGEASAIELCEIPAIFGHFWEIDEYDGDETVRVNVSQAYADILHAYMSSGDLATLVTQYRSIKTAESKMHRRPIIPETNSRIGDSEFMQSYKAGEWNAADLTAIFRAMAGGVKDTGLVDDENDDHRTGADSIGHA